MPTGVPKTAAEKQADEIVAMIHDLAKKAAQGERDTARLEQLRQALDHPNG